MTVHLRVRNPGLLTTVQDRGRFAHQHIGVPVSGALDATSFQIANALAGNAGNTTAAFEAMIVGPDLEAVGGAVRFALAGAACDAKIIGETPRLVPPLQSATLQPGEVLRVGPLKDASCLYLAVEGGFSITPVLGSQSTYARGKIGGFKGRALQAGDEIPLVLPEPSARPEHELPEAPDFGSGPVRIVMGPQDDYFSQDGHKALLESEFTVSKDADRVGIRLNGPKIYPSGKFEMPSDGTVTGNIQIPGTGEPIILLADRSTTGGYPKIATIVSAELPRVARLLPGQTIRFTAISQIDGVAFTRARHRYLEELLARIQPAIRRDIDSSQLLALNLVGGVVSACGET